jgi:hypothetical protein
MPLIALVVASLYTILGSSEQTKIYLLPSAEIRPVEAKTTTKTNSTHARNVVVPSADMNIVSKSSNVVVANAGLGAVVDLPFKESREIKLAAEAKTKPPSEMERLWEITKPFANITTIGFKEQGFPSGYRNQIQSFSAFVVLAGLANHSQILMPTIRHKDTFGTYKFMPFEFLFDVEHWNSFYPALPRMVHCDHELFPNYNCAAGRWRKTDKPTLLHAEMRRPSRLFGIYMRYSMKRKGPMMAAGFRNPMELLMIKGALRPHPDLLAISNRLLGDLGGNGTIPYMTLHARVEPDMMKHPLCWVSKITNLTDIFRFLEETFPDPPATRIFIPINRQHMEAEGKINTEEPNSTNWMAVHNLNELNRAVKDGLWSGRAKVFEFGSNMLKGTKYESRAATSGAVLNFFIAQNANVFVGTRVSTYSMDLLHARFYNGTIENYQYLPAGLERWTDNTTKHPPGFGC